MKKSALVFAIFLLLSFVLVFLSSCEKEEASQGRIHLSLTDAPIDDYNITGVFIMITEIQYNYNESWIVFEGFEGPQTFNLLELTHGESELLGNFPLESGRYNQIRFMLEAPEHGFGPPSNPGCYLEFEGGETQPLFVPSGAQSGYKAVGSFEVPVNGEVAVTADFDVRKSVVEAGNSGRFILKPTIRLIVENQAGTIIGEVLNAEEGMDVAVYAYEAGTYEESESADPEPENPRFPNAINSDLVNEVGGFTLAFMAEGNYDLVFAGSIDGAFAGVIGVVNNVEVVSQEVTEVSVDLSAME